MTALIDADILVYRAIAVTTSEVDWDGDGDVPLHNLAAAKQIVDELAQVLNIDDGQSWKEMLEDLG